jgi:hypothetical protein
MNNLGMNMRQRIAVQYHNEAGTKESGVDAGGLFKEFWTDLSAIAFDPNYALFRMTEGKNQEHTVLVLHVATNLIFLRTKTIACIQVLRLVRPMVWTTSFFSNFLVEYWGRVRKSLLAIVGNL